MKSQALFLVGSKLGFKLCLFVFLLIVARHLSREDFGDFQFISGIVNVLTQPAVLFSMLAVKIGFSFPAESRASNLRWLFARSPLPIVLAVLLLLGAAALLDPVLASLTNVEHSWSFLVAAGIVVGAVVFNYAIGFLQAVDRFRWIGVGFLVMGLLTIAFGVTMKLMNLDVRGAYAAQAAANGGAALLVVGMIHFLLPRNGVAATTDLKVIGRFSVKLLLVLVAFFGMLNLDIFATKLLFDRAEAGWYLQHEFIARLCFVTASALAMVIFPRTLQHAEAGRNPASELKRCAILFGGLCAVLIGGVMVAPQRIFSLIFGTSADVEVVLLALILSARLLQSSLFMLINYAGTQPTRPLVAVVTGSFGLEFVALLIWHDSMRTIATVALTISAIAVAATVVLLHCVRPRAVEP